MSLNKYTLLDRAIRAILPVVGWIKTGGPRPGGELAPPPARLFDLPPCPRQNWTCP